MNVDLIQISTKTTEKALDRERVISELTNLKEEDRRLSDRVSWRKKTLNTLYLALDKLCFESNAYWEREIEYTGSMEKQIDNHMQHGSKSLAKEKKILREIHMCQQSDDSSNFLLKELTNILISLKWRYHNIEKNCEQVLREIKEFELAREKAIDNVAVMGKIWSSVGLREAMRNQVKMILDELMVIKKKRLSLATKMKHVGKELDVIEKETWCFQTHLKHQGNDEAYICRFDLDQYSRKELWIMYHSKLGHESC
ncbi:proton pump-interactor 1-like, partial [Quillaja saponaria]